MRYNVVFAGTLELIAPPAPVPTPLPDPVPTPTLEDAGVIFDPKFDRHQVDATTDEFRLVVTPAGLNPSRPPAAIMLAAYTAGSVPAGASEGDLAALSPIATTEIPVSTFGAVVGRLEGLPSAPYDLAILTGFND